MDRRVTPTKRVTSPTWGPLGAKNRYLISRKSNQNWTVLMNCPRCRELDLEREKMPNTFEKRLILTLSWFDSLTIVAQKNQTEIQSVIFNISLLATSH